MSAQAKSSYGAELRAMLESVLATGRSGVGAEALSRAALAMVDDVAIAVGAGEEPHVRAYRAMCQKRSGLAEAVLFAPGAPKIDRILAASANALAMTAAEFDEGSRSTPCHAGLYTIPAMLAEAEAAELTMAEVLRLEVLAYEIVVRIADSWKATAGAYPNLYTHAKSGTIGAAVASALVNGLPPSQLFDVIGVAATLTMAGPRSHLLGGAPVRDAWSAAATHAGMMSVEWARFGALGLPTSIEDVFHGVLGLEPNPGPLRRSVDGRWEVLNGYHRVHSCHLFCNALVECLLEIRGGIGPGFDVRDIQAINVEIHDDAVGLTDTEPQTALAARFSVPHLVAAVLTVGNAGLDAFSTARLNDPAIAALRRKVVVAPLPQDRFPGAKWPAAVRIETNSGAFQASRAEAIGGHGQPHSDEAVFEKIAGLAETNWPAFTRLGRRLVALDPEILSLSVGEFFARATASRA